MGAGMAASPQHEDAGLLFPEQGAFSGRDAEHEPVQVAAGIGPERNIFIPPETEDNAGAVIIAVHGDGGAKGKGGRIQADILVQGYPGGVIIVAQPVLVLVSLDFRLQGIHQFSPRLGAVVFLPVAGINPAVVKNQRFLPEALFLQRIQPEPGHLAAGNGTFMAQYVPVLHFVLCDGNDIARDDVPVPRSHENFVPGAKIRRGGSRKVESADSRRENDGVLAHGRVLDDDALFSVRNDFPAEAVIVIRNHVDDGIGPGGQQAGRGQHQGKADSIVHRWVEIYN